MPWFDKDMMITASKSEVWQYIRYRVQGDHKRVITAEDVERLLIARWDDFCLIYVLQPVENNPAKTRLRMIVTSDVNAHETLAYRDDLDAALRSLPGDKPGIIETPEAIQVAEAHLRRARYRWARSHVPAPVAADGLDVPDPDISKIKNDPDSFFWLNPGNAGSVKHKTSLLINLLAGRGCMVLLLWFISLGIALLAAHFTTRTLMLTVFDHTTTDAAVTGLSTYGCGKNNASTCYQVEYDYQDGGRMFHAESTVSFHDYTVLRSQTTLPVTYSQYDPSIVEPGTRSFGLLDIVGALFALMFIGLSVWSLRWFGRLRELYRSDGTLCYGKLLLLQHEIEEDKNGKRLRLKAFFEFATPGGMVIQDESSELRPYVEPNTLPQTGSVAVFYVSDGEYRLL